MAQNFNEYLAINVLNERNHVTYRTLSRALKVHCNLAKQMLWEFHHKQNTKKPGSVHATYLISGYRVAESNKNGETVQSQESEDAAMPSSPPFPSSSAAQPEDSEVETVRIRSVVLVREEHLDRAKETFDNIIGMHMYSLQASGLGDFQALTECNRSIAATLTAEDPLVAGKQYGTIQNTNVKRRTRKTGPPPAIAAKSVSVKAPEPAKPNPPMAEPKQAADEGKQAPSKAPMPKAPAEGKATANKPPASKTAPVKRKGSDIFKSFAKGANKPTKATTETSPAAAPAASAPEDESMGGMSEDEADAGANDAEIEVNAPSGKSKKDRQAELKAMMDAEDEEMEDAAEAEEPIEQEQSVDTLESQDKEEPDEKQKESVVVDNGRRRGRRKVMKKKTVRDEEGFLVTKEEPAWESFSEEEPASKKAKMAPSVPSAKDGKKGGKAGQGSIMSFFAKK